MNDTKESENEVLEAKAIIDAMSDEQIKLPVLRGSGGYTPLIILAAQGNKTDLADLLIDRGAEVNLTDEDGWSPLFLASKKAHKDIVKLLLDHDASPSSINDYLSVATEKNYTEIIDLLNAKLIKIKLEINYCEQELYYSPHNIGECSIFIDAY